MSGASKIRMGLEEALAIAKGEAEPARVTHFKYVIHQNVARYEALGWTALKHVLEDTHHGHYSHMMRWDGEGEPVE